MEVQGTFNAQRFFDTLAMIISQREGVKVTVTVFQSTLPSQGATRLIDGSKSHEEFQSTLPSQGATVLIIVNFDKI